MLGQPRKLFAHVTLNEGIAKSNPGKTITDFDRYDSTGPKLSRRMLLQSGSDGLKDAQSSVGTDVFAFEATPKSMISTFRTTGGTLHGRCPADQGVHDSSSAPECPMRDVYRLPLVPGQRPAHSASHVDEG
eukprot:2047701-Rhodomonas_salina.4